MHFITGNAHKLKEVQGILTGVKGWDIDLPEVQHFSAQVVIQEKLNAACQLPDTPSTFFIEDTSLYIDCLKGLPGPLVKWFIAKETLGNEGLAELVAKYPNQSAQAKTMVGLYKDQSAYFFEGIIEGQIVAPRGKNGFGWDAIFQPKGSELTFAEMNTEQKLKVSMRRLAFEKLKTFLN